MILMNETLSVESYIQFCDNMVIAEESMRLKEFHTVKKDTSKKISDLEKKANNPQTSISDRIRIYKSLLKITDNAIQTVHNMQPDQWDKFFNVLGWLGYIAGTATKIISGMQRKQNSYNNTMTKNTIKSTNKELEKMNPIDNPGVKNIIDGNNASLANLETSYRKVAIKQLIIYASSWGVSFVGKKNTLRDKQKTKDQLLSTFSKKYVQYDAEIKRLERMRER